MKKKLIKKAFFVLIVFFFFIYVGYQIYVLNNNKVKTEPAVYATIDKSVDLQGFIIRDETVIDGDSTDVVSYIIADGDRVASGGIVAEKFIDYNNIVVKKEIESLDEELEKLKSLNDGIVSTSTNPERINKQISQELKSMLLSAGEDKYSSILNNRTNLLYLINQYKIITGDDEDFSNRIQELQKKREELSLDYKKSVNNITVPKSGYFSNFVDGYENLFDYNSIFSLKLSDIKNAIKNKKENNEPTIGKVITNVNWYVLCEMNYNKAVELDEKQDLTIVIPRISNEKIPCTIQAINRTDNKSNALIILKCNYMSKELSKIRDEQIKLNLESYSGIKVSKQAIHKNKLRKTIKDESGNNATQEKEVQGVYVLYGGKLKFKQIVPAYSDADFVICQKNPNKDMVCDGEVLDLYDRMVVGGVELYDGKIIK